MFRKFMAATGFANLADGIATLAWVWVASTLTRDAALIAMVPVALYLPWAIFAIPAGIAADRVDRRRLVIAMDLVRALAFLVAGAALALRSEAAAAPMEGVELGAAFHRPLPLCHRRRHRRGLSRQCRTDLAARDRSRCGARAGERAALDAGGGGQPDDRPGAGGVPSGRGAGLAVCGECPGLWRRGTADGAAGRSVPPPDARRGRLAQGACRGMAISLGPTAVDPAGGRHRLLESCAFMQRSSPWCSMRRKTLDFPPRNTASC
ncbi:MAG: MFS transporter [Tabrizicola sp.]|nr:MFS transporter [Tabrizicola sp.]